jgi:dihydrofolate reductase
VDQHRVRKLIVSEWVTLDGVMQAPGLPDEDTEGGFTHGGWQVPYFDEVFADVLTKTIAASDAFLLGRKTYDIFAGYWPTATGDLARSINGIAKYVVSRTRGALEWQNSTLIKGDVAPEIARLKQQAGKNILVIGSGELVQALIRYDLVDEYQLMVHPLVLGSGRRLFRDGDKQGLALVESQTTTKGVVILNYRATS